MSPTEKHIKELWGAVKHNERVLYGGVQFDQDDTSTHPMDFGDGEVKFLLLEIDWLRAKLGMKKLEPKK